MFSMLSMSMVLVSLVLIFSILSTVISDCDDRDTGPITSLYGNAPVIYREFPANYSVRPFCPEGQQVTEISMMRTCNAKDVPIYPIPSCGKNFTHQLNNFLIV